MKPVRKLALLLLALVLSIVSKSGAQKIEWLKDLDSSETFLSAKLTAAEQREIISQLESTSFDAPDSWETELRARRVSLGGPEGLVVRGTDLLCGGTGNCQTWVFRRSQGKWLNMFELQAPIVSGFGFGPVSSGIKDFLVTANNSAGKETRILFKFDGKAYRQNECYDVSGPGAAQGSVTKVPCK